MNIDERRGVVLRKIVFFFIYVDFRKEFRWRWLTVVGGEIEVRVVRLLIF